MAQLVSIAMINATVPAVEIKILLGGGESLVGALRSESKNAGGYINYIQGLVLPIVNPEPINSYNVTIRDYNPAFGSNVYQLSFVGASGAFDLNPGISVPYADGIVINNDGRGQDYSRAALGVLEYSVNRSMMHIVHDIPFRSSGAVTVIRPGGHSEMTVTLLLENGEYSRAVWEELFSAGGNLWIRRTYSNQKDIKGIVKQWRFFHAPAPLDENFIPGSIRRGVYFQAQLTLVVTSQWP